MLILNNLPLVDLLHQFNNTIKLIKYYGENSTFKVVKLLQRFN